MAAGKVARMRFYADADTAPRGGRRRTRRQRHLTHRRGRARQLFAQRRQVTEDRAVLDAEAAILPGALPLG